MTRTVQIDLSVADAQAVRAWQRSKDSVMAYQQAVAGIAPKTKKAQTQAQGFFNTTSAGMAKAAAQFLGVGTAIGAIGSAAAVIRGEYDLLINRQREAANTRVTFEDELAQAVRNASGIFSAQQVRQQSLQLASSAGISTTKAAGLVGSALTSTGVTNQAEARLAISAAGAAARYAPELDAGGTQSLAGVGASLAKRFGTSPEAAIGFVQKVGGQSNIRDLTPLVENVAPNLANLTDFGFSPGQAGALISTITQRSGDTQGAESSTAALAFAASLRERFRGADGSFDPIAAIERLQGDPALRRTFLEGGTIDGRKFGKARIGKGKALPVIESLLTAGSQADNQYTGSLAAIGNVAGGQSTYDELVREIGSVTAGSRLQRQLEAQAALVQSTSGEALGGIAREKFIALQQARGAGFLETKAEQLRFEASTDFGTENVPGYLIGRTRDALRADAQRRQQRSAPEPGFGLAGFQERRKLTVSDPDSQTKALQSMLTELKGIRKATESGTNININGQPKEGQIVNPAPKRPAARVGRRKK